MQIINLLWTGGWDSSFRLLDALLIKKMAVRTYYIIDHTRPSFAQEIKTISLIKNIIKNRYNDVKDKLFPTNFYLISDIQPDHKITQKFNNLKAKDYLGIQYEWLARFAEENNFYDLELSIHKGGNSFKFLEKSIELISNNNNNYYKLKSDIDANNDLSIFKYYRFPVLNLSKLDMKKIATKNNFDDILNLTWFCHKPVLNKPCGICVPCRQTIKYGMGERIPVSGKIKYNIYKLLNSILKN